MKELIAAVANIEPKHQKEIAVLKDSYKNSYSEWVFQLRYGLLLLRSAELLGFVHSSLGNTAVVVDYFKTVYSVLHARWDSTLYHKTVLMGSSLFLIRSVLTTKLICVVELGVLILTVLASAH